MKNGPLLPKLSPKIFLKNGLIFWARRDSIERNSYGNVAGWVAVQHSRYCIKTTKPILKLFGPPGSPNV